ncbi:Fis family transcriptional regulator [Fusobacterium necrophorum BFTR-2]|nr:sigma 54-interacting transcriptional regulator [Fusobacterium necrophorum]KDE74901.1 Fis family transcriptional regulator [Fusobacterium necrophorum BFTR-2]
MGEDILNIFKKIVESSYDGIYVTDGEGNTLFLNQAYEDITGLSMKELQGKNMEELVKKGFYSESSSLLAIKKRSEASINQKLKSGKEIFVTSTPVFDKQGKIIYVVTNVRDMRELERLEQQFSNVKKLAEKYKSELDFLKKKNGENESSKNREMLNILKLIETTAKFDSSILLEGETGTGKTHLAYIIHEKSLRKEKAFIEVNCGAIPKNLIESELFGYERGAFTGADKNGKMGLFELANHSTLFLDEISELSVEMQVKLLKVLETSYVVRVGGNKKIPIDVRIITASNKCIRKLVEEGKFREDLFYRINVVRVHIPPIRDRKEDIIDIVLTFLKQLNKRYGLNKRISKEVFQYFLNYSWPGNIREIKNMIEQLVVISTTEEITEDLLPKEMLHASKEILEEENQVYCQKCMEKYLTMSLKEATNEFQRDVIEKLLIELKSQRKVAERLEVNPSTITRKLQEK